MLLLKKIPTLVSYVGCFAVLLQFSGTVKATTLTAVISSDEEFEAYISISGISAGIKFLASTGTEQGPVTGTVELAEGVLHYLHIRASGDLENPSSLIGTFSLDDFGFIFPNLRERFSTNLDYWTVSRTGFGTKHEFLSDLGPNGIGPWGTQTGVDPEARYIWSDSETGDHYFSLGIMPTNSTPRRFVVGVQPEFNNSEGIVTRTEGFPNTLNYQDGPSRALAVADPGRVGARAEDNLTQGPGDLFTASWASYDSPDFVLSTTGNETSAEVSLNFLVKGSMIGGAGKGGLPVEVSTASSQLDVYAQINSEPIYFGRGIITARHEVGTETPGTEVTVSDIWNMDLLPDEASGDAGDFMAEYNVEIEKFHTTPSYTIEVGVPFNVMLNTTAISSAKSDQGAALSKIDFTGGISFPTSGDVFNLPPGFTVNSISGRVVNNRFEVDGTEPEESTPFVEGFYLNIPGIPGGSAAPAHEEWIEFESASSAVSNLSEGSPPNMGDIVVTKTLDKSSPLIAQSLVNGTIHEDVILEINKYISGNRASHFEYRLKEAVITEYHMKDRLSPNPENEVFTLNYSRVDWLHQTTSWTGKVFEEVSAWWDVGSSQGGSESIVSEGDPPGFNSVENQTAGPSTYNQLGLVVGDPDTDLTELIFDLITTREDLIRDLSLTGTGANRQLSYTTSALHSGFGSIQVIVFDGTFERSISIPVLINVEMTPFEGFLSAYFSELELLNREITSPIQDPDKDGIATIIEFLLGTNPNEFNMTSEAMNVAFNSAGSERTITLNFKKRLDDPNIQGYFWGSLNGKDWTRMDDSNPLYEETGNQGQNPLFEERTGTVTLPQGTEPFFIRYQVQNVF